MLSKYSVCCLSRDKKNQDDIFKLLKRLGFSNDQIFISDNSHNTFDSYEAIRIFLRTSNHPFVIILHDDIDFGTATLASLEAKIEDVILKDPRASVFGVAGISFKGQQGVGRFFDSNFSEQSWGFKDFGKASSLDECFLVIRKDSWISVSDDLSGFHFYGTDLCLNAEKLGFSSYVVDFPVIHRSEGTLNSDFYSARDRFELHLREKGIHRFIRTTCTILYGGSSKIFKAWALSLSLLLVRSSGHRDLSLSELEIYKRGHALVGNLFSLFVFFASAESLVKMLPQATSKFYWCRLHGRLTPVRRVVTDVLWWMKNWRSRL